MGTHSAEAVLLTSHNEALATYGQTPGEPASISMEAAFAYTSALNGYLTPRSRHSVQLGETTVVFWADAAGDTQTAARCEDVLDAALTEAERTVEETLGAIACGPGGHGLRARVRAGVPTVRANLRAVTPYPSPPANGLSLTRIS